MSNDITIKKLLSLINLDDFVSIDIETTGLDIENDEIIEISACRFKNGVFFDEFTTLINPKLSIPKNISSLTSITNDMVKNAPFIDDVISDLMLFVDKSPLVAHNINFDYNFIIKYLPLSNNNFTNAYLYDTLSLSRSFLYFYDNFSLGSICNYYKINIENAHRAGSDSLATGKLFINLIKEVASLPLSLIQKINTLTNKIKINNYKLYYDIIKVSVSLNKLNGLFKLESNYFTPNNIYEKKGGVNSEIDNHPVKYFDGGGPLELSWKGYEKRMSQIEFVKDSHRAFSESSILIAEAGTGMGKSLAYIASGFFSSKKNKSPMVISTYTKNLQDQLFNNDIPKFASCIDKEITAVIYKGRNNYICKSRMETLINSHIQLLQKEEINELITLIVWEWFTITGDINECGGFNISRNNRLWALIMSENGYCSPRICKKYEGCYLERVRKKLLISDIIIINHFLFANELMSDGSFLPENFVYVIDEAHQFSKVVRDQLEKKINFNSFSDLFNFFDSKNNNWSKNFIDRYSGLSKYCNEMFLKSSILKATIKNFFDSYYNNKCDFVNNSDYIVNKVPFSNLEDEFINTDPNPYEVNNMILDFNKSLNDISTIINDKKDEIANSFLLEFHICEKKIADIIEIFKMVIKKDDTVVKWSTFTKSNHKNLTTLSIAPLSVKNFIYDNLISNYDSGIFCSATLMVNNDFRYFKDKVGLDLAVIEKNIIEKSYQSPFHYTDQARLFLFQKKIDVNDSLFIEEIGSQIIDICKNLNRRMLVLCTSFKQIRALKNYIGPKININKYKLLLQEPGVSKNVLISNYLDYSKSILVGTSSFWEGVDFPGDKVEILFIVKTPFDNPYDPIIQAQIRDYHNRGFDAFSEFQIPEAAMRFRQGFGRLIRDVKDIGICIIADTRLYYRSYGNIIMDSLPIDAIPYHSIDKILSESQKLFRT